MGEVTIDPTNPLQQIIAIAIGGLIASFLFSSWIKWVVWIVGTPLWFYFNFIQNTREGSIVQRSGDLI